MEHLGITPEFYVQSERAIQADPERNITMRKNAAKVELEERLRAMGPDYVILSRDEALEHIEKIEMLKVMNMTGAIIANKKGNLPDDRVSMIMEMAPMMAIDMYNK